MPESRRFTYDTTMFVDTFENDFTYFNGVARNFHRYASRPALTCVQRDRRWTYAELGKECNRLANALRAGGVVKPDVVMYQLYNCAEWAFLYLATQQLGAIGCPINYRLSQGETAYAIDDSKPRVYVYDAALAEVAQKALAAAKHRPDQVVMVDVTGQARPIAGAVSFEEYVQAHPDTPPGIHRPTHIYDETTRLYTSGTTGMPKGVPLNNVNEIFSAHDVIMHFPLSPRCT